MPPSPRLRRLSFVVIIAPVVLASLSVAVAQGVIPESPGVAPVEESGETVLSLILKGGWLMVPIGLCSVLALMFAIERAVSLRRARTAPLGLIDELYDILPAHPSWERQKRAARRLEESGSIAGDILRSGVLKLHRGRALAEASLGDAAAKEVHLLKRKLRPFAIVASLAPLLGLLGTIFGMITCFETATATDAASRTEVLAQGIYSALVTTAAGLSVAIPALALFHYFEGKVDRVVDELEESANEFLDHYFDDRPRPERAPRAEPASAPAAGHAHHHHAGAAPVTARSADAIGEGTAT